MSLCICPVTWKPLKCTCAKQHFCPTCSTKNCIFCVSGVRLAFIMDSSDQWPCFSGSAACRAVSSDGTVSRDATVVAQCLCAPRTLQAPCMGRWGAGDPLAQRTLQQAWGVLVGLAKDCRAQICPNSTNFHTETLWVSWTYQDLDRALTCPIRDVSSKKIAFFYFLVDKRNSTW